MILLFGIEALKSLIDSSLVYFISKNIAQTSMNIIGENIDIDTFGNQILYGSYALVIFKVLLLNLKTVGFAKSV